MSVAAHCGEAAARPRICFGKTGRQARNRGFLPVLSQQEEALHMTNIPSKFRLGPFLGLALALSALPALAQSGGSGGSGGGSSGGGAAGSAGGAGAGVSSGAGATGSAAARSRAARRSNNNDTNRSVGGGQPSGTAVPNPALNPNPALPGQSAVPSPRPGSNQAATPGRATGQGDLNSRQQGQVGARATNRGGMPDPTPNDQVPPNSPNDQSQPGQQTGLSGGGTARQGASGHDMKSCMEAWDAGTHMTKTQWRRVCANTLSDRRSMLRDSLK